MRSKRAPRRLNRKGRALKNVPVCQLPALFGSWLGLPATDPDGLYTSVRVFWLFLHQTLSDNGSCQEAVDEALVWIASSTGQTVSENTSAYCQARKRLSLEWLLLLTRRLIEWHESHELVMDPWCGRRVLVVDGSSSSMPDTKENQNAWPQPSSQKPGCGFPVVRFVALFSLATGAMLHTATGPLSICERELFRHLWHFLKPGDVILSDKGFGSFGEFHFLSYRGVDCVARFNESRTSGVRPVKRLGKGDWLVEWTRGRKCPDWIDPDVWKSLPEAIVVRQIECRCIRAGLRTKNITVVTTLLDAKQFPAEAFAELYLRRWNAELWLRDMKTTMGMDVLSSKSPDMISKELALYWIGYNLVRGLIVEAQQRYGRPDQRVSFKGCLHLVRTWAPVIAMEKTVAKQEQMLDLLLYYLSRQTVRSRLGRSQPRARKRRPKNYQVLTAPRSEFKEIPHRDSYTKEDA